MKKAQSFAIELFSFKGTIVVERIGN